MLNGMRRMITAGGFLHVLPSDCRAYRRPAIRPYVADWYEEEVDDRLHLQSSGRLPVMAAHIHIALHQRLRSDALHIFIRSARRAILGGATAAMLLTGHTKALAEENLLFEETKLAVTIKGEKADLEVLIAKEQGASKPLPLVIFTHGQSPDRKKRKGLKARNYEGTARDFARRGWIAAIVLRRGYGQSNMRTLAEISVVCYVRLARRVL